MSKSLSKSQKKALQTLRDYAVYRNVGEFTWQAARYDSNGGRWAANVHHRTGDTLVALGLAEVSEGTGDVVGRGHGPHGMVTFARRGERLTLTAAGEEKCEKLFGARE